MRVPDTRIKQTHDDAGCEMWPENCHFPTYFYVVACGFREQRSGSVMCLSDAPK